MAKLILTDRASDRIPSIAEGLSKLQKSAAELNSLTDRVNNTLREVEGILDAASIGIPVYAELPQTSLDQDEIDHNVDIFVAYLQTKEKNFRIALVASQEGDEVFCKFWPECARLDKLRILENLPLLLNELLTEVQKRIETIKSSVALVEIQLLEFPPVKAKG